ncbi:hypothetical protein E2C01_063377 [Portunus trituberculatus]|uniref:Uncharacterized protein n=1 Tax=Portunus trituberculatus TaxID=210409 RepID=A0A5B7HDI4_PORTR|nr:hypothetical protein [Portunus trituberculatus]
MSSTLTHNISPTEILLRCSPARPDHTALFDLEGCVVCAAQYPNTFPHLVVYRPTITVTLSLPTTQHSTHISSPLLSCPPFPHRASPPSYFVRRGHTFNLPPVS